MSKNSGKTWTNEEDLFLAENYEDMTNDELAEKLGRTKVAIASRLKILFLVRSEPIYAYYIGDDYQRSGTIKELAEYYGVKENTIKFYTSKANMRRKSRIRVVRT